MSTTKLTTQLNGGILAVEYLSESGAINVTWQDNGDDASDATLLESYVATVRPGLTNKLAVQVVGDVMASQLADSDDETNAWDEAF